MNAETERKKYKRDFYYRGEPTRLITKNEQLETPTRKISIVGTADSGEHAPWNDMSWEIWAVGGPMPWESRYTRWYDVHRNTGNGEQWCDNWRALIKDFEGDPDIWMHYPLPGFGDRVHQYPVEAISKRFGTYFMTSSFAWMMAQAIDELRPLDGEDVSGEIGLFGIDMEAGTEFFTQRDGTRHFIELACFVGIPVTRLAASGIVNDPVPYPERIDDPLLNKIDVRQILTIK